MILFDGIENFKTTKQADGGKKAYVKIGQSLLNYSICKCVVRKHYYFLPINGLITIYLYNDEETQRIVWEAFGWKAKRVRGMNDILCCSFVVVCSHHPKRSKNMVIKCGNGNMLSRKMSTTVVNAKVLTMQQALPTECRLNGNVLVQWSNVWLQNRNIGCTETASSANEPDTLADYMLQCGRPQATTIATPPQEI